MARIPATRKELKDSFKQHYLVYQKICENNIHTPLTRRLILFYSVECGLKYYLLDKIIKKNTTQDLENHREYNNPDGHDIRNLIKFARLGDHANFQLNSYNSQKTRRRIEPKELHQIWRYGIEIDDSDYENKSEKTLQNVAVWLKERI